MPMPRGTKKSDKTRAYQTKYDAENYKTAACKLRIEDYEKFDTYAKRLGGTVSSLLKAYINDCIKD